MNILPLFPLFFAGLGVVNAPDLGRVISKTAIVRETQAANGYPVAELSNGQTVEIMAEKGEWYLIQTKKHVGWIHIDEIEPCVDRSRCD